MNPSIGLLGLDILSAAGVIIDIEDLINAFQDANKRIAPEIELRLQIGLSRHCFINNLLQCLGPFWGYNIFYSINLYADEFAQPIEFLINNYIRLNITPISNVKLGRVQELMACEDYNIILNIQMRQRT